MNGYGLKTFITGIYTAPATVALLMMAIEDNNHEEMYGVDDTEFTCGNIQA